ncbi:glycosyl transferase family 28 [Aureispira]|nr:glycosyl transferase family 28 [Aureispira sp.]
MKNEKKILIAPLNWGLGHAVRCIPLINAFICQGAKVILASDGDALNLLRAEYPELESIELPSYKIHYKTANMFLNIAPQVPKLLKAIRLERRFLDTIISKRKIDAIISDNRFGIHHSKVPSVYMTHQLNIPVPNRFVQAWVTGRNNRYISKFDSCWVPDFEGEPNLAGALSHGEQWQNVSYLGLLSRMEYTVEQPVYDVIVVLSGLEPQRSIFEQEVIEQARQLSLKFLIVSGKTDKKEHRQLYPNIEWHSFMTTKELNKAILQSRIVIARSGYTTIMDLVKLKAKQVLLVPTPGQTEQEYLAERFCKNNQFLFQRQKDFNIKTAIEELSKFKGVTQYPLNNNYIFEKIISDFLDSLN